MDTITKVLEKEDSSRLEVEQLTEGYVAALEIPGGSNPFHWGLTLTGFGHTPQEALHALDVQAQDYDGDRERERLLGGLGFLKDASLEELQGAAYRIGVFEGSPVSLIMRLAGRFCYQRLSEPDLALVHNALRTVMHRPTKTRLQSWLEEHDTTPRTDDRWGLMKQILEVAANRHPEWKEHTCKLSKSG